MSHMTCDGGMRAGGRDKEEGEGGGRKEGKHCALVTCICVQEYPVVITTGSKHAYLVMPPVTTPSSCNTVSLHLPCLIVVTMLMFGFMLAKGLHQYTLDTGTHPVPLNWTH